MDEVPFHEPIPVAPKFAEMAALEERRPLPTGALFEENADHERDLEVPTFMRRSPLF
jgi:hypothetical protein